MNLRVRSVICGHVDYYNIFLCLFFFFSQCGYQAMLDIRTAFCVERVFV